MQRIPPLNDNERCKRHRAVNCTECVGNTQSTQVNCSVSSCSRKASTSENLCAYHSIYKHLDKDLLSQWINKHAYHMHVAVFGQSQDDNAKTRNMPEWELLPAGAIEMPVPPVDNEGLKSDLESGKYVSPVYTRLGIVAKENHKKIKAVGLDKYLHQVKMQFSSYNKDFT